MIGPASNRRIISLLSGTSADGVDAGLVLVREIDGKITLDLESFATFEYPPPLRRRVHAAHRASTSEIARLNAVLGETFANAAQAVLDVATREGKTVDAIASHGQTVLHLPMAADEGPATTLQLGEGDRIAERTGKVTVCDFRQRDLAAGGEGAPLTPFLDHVLFGEPGRLRVAVNLGGILNLSAVTGVLEETVAFDVGPANSILDGLVEHLTGGAENYDRNGERARAGTVDPRLLDWILSHEYFARIPPKSTGRELFGADFVRELDRVARGGPVPLRGEDFLATATLAVARSLRVALERFVEPRHGAPCEVILSGGGVHNSVLFDRIVEEFPAGRVLSSADLGVSPDGKEALLFALLAHETLSGRPSNVCSATGAIHPVSLGKICLGSRCDVN